MSLGDFLGALRTFRNPVWPCGFCRISTMRHCPCEAPRAGPWLMLAPSQCDGDSALQRVPGVKATQSSFLPTHKKHEVSETSRALLSRLLGLTRLSQDTSPGGLGHGQRFTPVFCLCFTEHRRCAERAAMGGEEEELHKQSLPLTLLGQMTPGLPAFVL